MSDKKADSDFLQLLALGPYRLLGDRISKILPYFRGIENSLPRANIKVTFSAYVSLLLFFSAISGFSIFALILLISWLSGAFLVNAFLVAFVLAMLCGFVVFVSLYLYPSMVAGGRGRILEAELPYVASHMAVLSRANMSPERIFRSLVDVESMGIKSIAAEESKNIIRDVQLMGYDILTAMEQRIKHSPSSKFVDFLDGFISVTKSGGDLTNYFLTSAKVLMDSARIAAQRLVENLGAFAEAYVSLMVVFPLLVIIMLSVMGMIGGNIGGIGILFLMQVVTYLAIPACAAMLLLFLDSMMPPR